MKAEKKYEELAKDTILFGISNFSSKILIILLLPLYTSRLTTVEYGQVDLLTNIVNLLCPLLTLDIAESVLRFALAKEYKKNSVLSTGFVFVLLGTIILIVLTPLSRIFGETMEANWWYFILLFGGYSLQNLFSYYCRGSDRKKIFAIQGIIQTVSLLTLNLIFLVLFQMGMSGYMLALIFSYYIAVTFMFVKGELVKELLPIKLDSAVIKTMLSYSAPLIPAVMTWWINSFADKYVIIGIIGMGASGIYSVAHKIPTVLTTITDIFNQAFLISAVKNIEDNDMSFYRKISTLFLVVNCFACATLITGSKIMGTVLFSKDYYQGWIYVPPLLLASAFSAMSAYLASFYRALKKTKILFSSTVVGAIINISLSILLALYIGTIGVAIATAFSFFVVFSIRYVILKKYMDLSLLTPPNLLTVLLIVLQAVITVRLNTGLYVGVVTLAALLILNFKEIKQVYTLIINKFRK